MITPSKTYPALTLVLGILCALLACGALVLLFATGWLASQIIDPANVEAFVWVLVLFKAFGAFALIIAYLTYNAARDPIRYLAVIDGLIGLLILVSILDAYAVLALGFGAFYPAWAMWFRITLRIAVAVLLLVLRPSSPR